MEHTPLSSTHFHRGFVMNTKKILANLERWRKATGQDLRLIPPFHIFYKDNKEELKELAKKQDEFNLP